MNPDYQNYTYGDLIEVKQYLEKNDRTGPYRCVINEIFTRFPELNSETKNTIDVYEVNKTNMSFIMNQLYKFDSVQPCSQLSFQEAIKIPH